MDELIEIGCFGKIKAKDGEDRIPYEHQQDAMSALDKMNELSSFSTLVVLPTGGGKTYTASTWLLKNAINNKKKVLWIAHRTMLLDQALESFVRGAYYHYLTNVPEFTYRIISGDNRHDIPAKITSEDQLLIVGKDSLGRGLGNLDRWLSGESEIFFVIDEAHHSTAKTYRKIIEYIKCRVDNLKIIGLTATPTRTSENERGLLSKIYTDGIKNCCVTKGDVGIAYGIGLKELISREILSRPNQITIPTDQNYGRSLGVKALNSILHKDIIPEDIARNIANSTPRNKKIVETYIEHRADFGKTIVFAINCDHAIVLSKEFNLRGVKADFVISNVKDMYTGVTISREDNERKIRAFREGELDVLVNVNILTEGVDLPQTKTVFLSRPTISQILMTQMIGRALRGLKAGGTKDANIVSFFDDWENKVSWVNPQTIFDGENEFRESDVSRKHQGIRLIAISKIEEFVKVLDDHIDTTELESLPFIERIPVGMYSFSYDVENSDKNCQIMVYDSMKTAYERLMNNLPSVFEDFNVSDEEFIEEDVIDAMEKSCRNEFFDWEGNSVLPYDPNETKDVIRYYAQKGVCPNFYTFDEIDRKKLDVSLIARRIVDGGLSRIAENDLLKRAWESTEDNILKIFFTKEIFFRKSVETEIRKIVYPEMYSNSLDNKLKGTRLLSELSLYEMRKYDPCMAEKLRDNVFNSAKDSEGYYCCKLCGKRSKSRRLFQVDHINPMSNEGTTVEDNLQLLCWSCNAKKSDKI